MSWISYLCENEMREELIREVSECAESLGRTSEEVADGFLKAHKEIRLQKNNPAFGALNDIHDNMQKEVHDAKVSSVRVSSKK
tara:strand:+ start:99 stop:347 length:249 start_codon:yes stop_codon:yes gene_type:complete